MLPREIQTEHGPDYSRFDLPMRPIGPLRFIGLVPMAFAVFFAWMPGTQMLRFLRQILSGNSSGFEWVLVAFLSLFVVAAMMPFAFGLFILAGRTRITLRKDRMVLTELAGPARWSRKVKYEQVERLEIGGAQSSSSQTSGALSALCGVTAVLKDGKKMPVAIGYPRDWLQPLVEELSSTMRLRGAAVPVAEAKLSARTNPQPMETPARREKPVGSTIELTTSGWGVELRVAPRGLWKESYGFLGFGIVWCLIVGAVTAGGVFGKGSHGSLLGTLGFLALFWALGIGFLLLGIHLGTRRWTLRADHKELHVALRSALRTREWRWPANEITNIGVGDSGTKVNNQTLEQLQIETRTATRKTGMLTGRTHDELAWIATSLRESLGGQAAANTDAPPRIDPSRRQS